MKKSFSVAALVLSAALLFTGCNSDKKNEETTQEETTQEETTGSVFAPVDDVLATDVLTGETLPVNTEAESSAVNQESTSDLTEDGTVPNEAVTSAVSGSEAERTTASSAGNQLPNAAQPSQGSLSTPSVQAPASSEYDIVRSGTFHIKGSMVDSTGTTSPLEMAVTPDSVFMLSEFSEGVDIAMLVKNDIMYMIYPKEKAYMEMSDSLMKMAGLDVDEMISSDAVDFTEYGALSEAYYVVDEIYNGIDCKVYYIKDASEGSMRVYMNGDRLLRFAKYSPDGVFLSATEVEYISATVPADRSAPSADYKAYKGITGMAGFMGLLSDVM